MQRAPIVLAFLALTSTQTQAQQTRSATYELTGGSWFDGSSFVPRKLYVVDGVFRDQRPARVDSVIDLGNRYVVAPFGDAHTHAFDNANSISGALTTNLHDGIFYALSLTNSIAGKRAVAAQVNTPASVDVAYADAGLTSTRGHPVMSAEMAANRWTWDSLGKYWPMLLNSRKAEGDAYFAIDSLADFTRKWPAIVGSGPDLIKIYLMDTERYATLRLDTTSLDHNGLDPSLVPTIVAAAHRAGLRVAAHVETAADVHVALVSGVDIIAHLPGVAPRSEGDSSRYLLSEADAGLAARQGTVVVPTAWLATQGRIAGGDTAQVARAKRWQRRNLTVLQRNGVRIAVGADLFVTAKVEANYLLDLGVFDARTLLTMWSQTTPEVIFPHRRLGRLAPGHEASFLALACDPIADFSCTGKIAVRMKQGRLLTIKE